MASPFRITLYQGFTRTGWLGDPTSVEVVVRWNDVGTATLTIPTSHPKLGQLTVPGARILIEYQPDEATGWMHLLSGPVRQVTGSGTTLEGMVTVTAEDDFRLLSRILGWRQPGAAITAQGLNPDKRTGPLETVVKGFVSANTTRMNLPVTVEATHGWGDSTTLAVSMQPLADILGPAILKGQVGFRVRQRTTDLYVEAYQPATYPRTLSEAAGIVQSWSWSQTAPQVTRTVVASSGDGSSRAFTLYPAGVTTGRTTQETDWADVIESLTDATSTDVAAELTAAGKETLDSNGVKAGLSVVLSETASFRYGRSLNVGDLVNFQLGTGATISDRLTSCTVGWNRTDGLSAVPAVGDRTDDPTATLVATIARLARTVRGRFATR